MLVRVQLFRTILVWYRGACPCCVAETLGVKCEGGFVRNITFTSPTLLEEVRDNFVQGKTATVVGLGVLLGLCWIMACCCVRSILREVRAKSRGFISVVL